MNINLTDLEITTLSWISMDYESISTIINNITSDLGKPVSESEVHTALLSLQKNGFSESYYYDNKTNTFITFTPDKKICDSEIW